MRSRPVRFAIVASVLLALLFYFVPLIPYSYAVVCSGAFSCPPMGRFSGFYSLSTWLFHNGASYSLYWSGYGYSYGGGLYLGTYAYIIGNAGYVTTLLVPGGILLILAGCLLAGLLSPEIADTWDMVSVLFANRSPHPTVETARLGDQGS